jgi:hypothetical protein
MPPGFPSFFALILASECMVFISGSAKTVIFAQRIIIVSYIKLPDADKLY